jgi:hypothetical protein
LHHDTVAGAVCSGVWYPVSSAAPWRASHLARGEPEATARRFFAMARYARLYPSRACRVALSWAFEAAKQQINGLTHQLGTTGVLLVRQLIQQG